MADSERRILDCDDAAPDVKHFPGAQLRYETRQILEGGPARGYSKALARGRGSVGKAIEIIGDGEMAEAVALPGLHHAAVGLDLGCAHGCSRSDGNAIKAGRRVAEELGLILGRQIGDGRLESRENRCKGRDQAVDRIIAGKAAALGTEDPDGVADDWRIGRE